MNIFIGYLLNKYNASLLNKYYASFVVMTMYDCFGNHFDGDDDDYITNGD